MEINEQLKNIALILISYEMDEPHTDDEEDPIYPNITWEEFLMMLNNEHSGDCINMPVTCCRCVAETVLHKAKYILSKL